MVQNCLRGRRVLEDVFEKKDQLQEALQLLANTKHPVRSAEITCVFESDQDDDGMGDSVLMIW